MMADSTVMVVSLALSFLNIHREASYILALTCLRSTAITVVHITTAGLSDETQHSRTGFRLSNSSNGIEHSFAAAAEQVRLKPACSVLEHHQLMSHRLAGRSAPLERADLAAPVLLDIYTCCFRHGRSRHSAADKLRHCQVVPVVHDRTQYTFVVVYRHGRAWHGSIDYNYDS